VAEALWYKEDRNTLYLRAQGHITASLCADLRGIVFSRFETAPQVENMYVDLSACDYMDSTFMGLLVGFNKRLIKASGKKLSIVKPSVTALELLEGLGITTLVDLVDETVAFPSNMQNILKTQDTGPDLLLRTHENLMELSEENRKKFSILHSLLKNQEKKS
jgi:anti-anti-sigma factor